MKTIEEIKLEWRRHNREHGMTWDEIAELVHEVIASLQFSKGENKKIIGWLKKNGYKRIEPNSYVNDIWNVVLEDGYIAIANGNGDADYLKGHSLYALIGYLSVHSELSSTPTEQSKQEPSDSIQVGKKNGYLTWIFPDNEIFYSQDHGFWRGLPSGVEFSVDRLNKDTLVLVAEGYGALSNNPYGLKYHYGNGAIYVSESDLPNELEIPFIKPRYQ